MFFVSGLWHGAGIHYIVWGLMQGVFQIVGAITLPAKEKICTRLKIDRNTGLPLLLQHITTFFLINLSWLVFRANGTIAAAQMLKSIFTFSALPKPLPAITYLDLIILGISLLLLFSVSYYKEKGLHLRDEIAKQLLPIRWSIFLLLFAAILLFGIYGPGYSDAAFIYMNF